MRAILLLMFFAVTPAAGQTALAGRAGPRRLLPRADEIALARSAAPRYASQGATVWVLTEAGYVVAERGTTGVACYVSRSWRRHARGSIGRRVRRMGGEACEAGQAAGGRKARCAAMDAGAGKSAGREEPAGLFIIAARTDDEALAIARSCPHLRHGGTVSLRPIEPT